jgi:hypothetical protein
VKLRVKLLSFSWEHEFKILKGGPFPVILGLDFLRRTGMSGDVSLREYCFGFAPAEKGKFSLEDWDDGHDNYLQHLREEAKGNYVQPKAKGMKLESLVNEFPALFSSELGAAKCTPYDIELSVAKRVRSPPYRCAPPKLGVFREMIDDLLEKGVIRPSKSPYASPAFLLPKRGGGFRLVVDYRRVNQKIVFDSYPVPSIEQAFEQFGGATAFFVLDLNSAYYQIPLSKRSQRITAFCTPFGLFELSKLPMGISIGCQGLSRVIDELFAELKGDYVFNIIDDLVVYSSSPEEHKNHVREVLRRLQTTGFTLNPEKLRSAPPR